MLNEQNKRAFLHNVSLSLGRQNVPESITPFDFSQGIHHQIMSEVQTHEEAVARFKVECDNLGIVYTEVAPADLKKAIVDVIKANGGGKVIYPDVADIEAYGLDKAFADANGKDGLEFIQWDAPMGHAFNVQNAQDANIGITFPKMAIAETATLVQPAVAGSGRCVGLLPLTHLAVVKRSTIKRRMAETMKQLREEFQAAPSEFPSAYIHISGPSSTADIELVRVVGVHGPINITYIIVND